MREWPKLNSIIVGALEVSVGVGMEVFSFLLRLVTNYPGNLNGQIPMGRMATAWFQLVGSQTPLPPQS